MPDLTPDELLSTTRAVRRRLDLERPVDLSVIEDCIRLAVQAPTGGNKQDWRWIVITDPAVRSGLASLYRAGALDAFGQARDAAANEGARKAYDGAIHLATILEQVPVIVIPCALGRVDGANNHRAAGYYGSVIPAVWSFQLALRSRGLGSVFTTAHLRDEKGVAELLGVPEDVSQIAMLPVAYTIGQDFKVAERLPVAEVTYLNSWGNPW
ncbi:unannotated protein [freshwater metagenome]|uniref:Unannotated protein n=1 Tax=freshwater metagenome TaxID=449393 RepID=A0A6J7BRX1_9ZZZZ|nr:nitroreductase [Actinomycetota bacterium]MSW37793.1 nitroreductase [Actinomycetota bacterium]MSX38133.1 nitroreductase [Actinomycetota bacterium]